MLELSPQKIMFQYRNNLNGARREKVKYKMSGLKSGGGTAKSGGGTAKKCTLLIIIPLRAYLAIRDLLDLKLSLSLKIGRVWQ